ncbi:MAG: hypothetical protein SZ59_C0001G0198 [candidate division TM6 bacterium GW2011_GWF2_28_16]|nr:MAG: hypothetical protein SZ59_C0001G0198 [candidate division TM6 bacterium GW2011_GWF2_28_16]
MKNKNIFLIIIFCNFYNLYSFDFFKIFRKPDDAGVINDDLNTVSFAWKENISKSFNNDINFIESIVVDGPMQEAEREDFLGLFKEQQTWFDNVISSTQYIGDSYYKEVEEKKKFVSVVANSVRRADVLSVSLIRKLKLNEFEKNKLRLNFLIDINNYAANEFKQNTRLSSTACIPDRDIKNIVNNNIKIIRENKNNNKNNYSRRDYSRNEIGRLITKNDYQGFSNKLSQNISGGLKNIFTTLENDIEKAVGEQSQEARRKYEDMLNSLDEKLSTTQAKLQSYIDQKMQEFGNKIDEITSTNTSKKGLVDLDNVENKFKDYLDKRMKTLESKLDNAKMPNVATKKSKPLFDVSKQKIDEKIYEEVGRQLASLKEERIKTIEKLAKKDKKKERRKLMLKLLDEE